MTKAKPQKTKAEQEPSKLDEHLEEIVQMKLSGVSDRKIADHLGVSNTAVSRWVKRPNVQKEIDEAHKELTKRAQRQLGVAAGWAVQTLIRFVNPENAEKIPLRYQLQATKIMLDTIGVGRFNDIAEMGIDSTIETSAETARAKAADIEARILEAASIENSSDGLRVVKDEAAG
jgi:predicted transcriptional regulator